MAKKPAKKVAPKATKKPVEKVEKPDVRAMVSNALHSSGSNQDRLNAIMKAASEDDSPYANKVREVARSSLMKQRRLDQIQSL